MITLYLKFPSEAAALAAFTAVTGQPVAALGDVPSKVAVNGLLCDIDPIGVVTRDTGSIDLDGNPITETVDGWHVNVWMPDDGTPPPELEPFRLYPATPSRVFM